MVVSSFRLDRALIFLFVAILIASPLVLVFSGVSALEAITMVSVAAAISFIGAGASLYYFYRIFLDILGIKKLDGKYGGSGKWKYPSISSDLAVVCIGFYSAKIVSSSGVYCV